VEGRRGEGRHRRERGEKRGMKREVEKEEEGGRGG
jgi:hypothetical protein